MPHEPMRVAVLDECRIPRLITGHHGAITQYVEREEKRKAFKQDAQQAWEDYRQTGLHLTFEEGDAWLSKLESGEDMGPPECHD